MVQCPNCSSQIDQEFGMVTCQECQAVFMIDFSGNVEFSDGKSVLSEPIIDDQSTAVAPEEDELSDFVDIEQHSIIGESPEEEAYEESQERTLAEYQPYEDITSNPDPDPVEASEEDYIEEYEEIEEAPMPPRVSVPDTEPVDITEFANSEESSLEEGLYLYNLSIDRIDSRELRETVKYVLGDDKLKLDLNEVMKALKNGKLVIHDLHPLKAKRIIEQLQYFDFDIRWEQHLVVLEDEATEMDIDADL